MMTHGYNKNERVNRSAPTASAKKRLFAKNSLIRKDEILMIPVGESGSLQQQRIEQIVH